MERFRIEQPSVEQLFQRAIDQAGYHDAESLPTAEVRRLFISFFNYQQQWNQKLQNALDDYNATNPRPILSPSPPQASAAIPRSQ